MNITSSQITNDDIRFITYITKSLLENGLPTEIINKIIKLAYTTNHNEFRYWEFHQHCGSGGDIILMKMSSMGDVEIICKHMWMSNNNRFMICKGKYTPVYGSNGISYGLVVIKSIIKRSIVDFKVDSHEENILHEDTGEIYFDFLLFDKIIKSEWGENIPLNLYWANGGQSTEHFNAYINLNQNINYVKDADTKQISMLARGLKLEEISTNNYNSQIISFERSGF